MEIWDIFFFLRGGKCFNQMFRGRGYGAGGGFAPPQILAFFQFTNHLKPKTVGFRFDTGYPLSETFIPASINPKYDIILFGEL